MALSLPGSRSPGVWLDVLLILLLVLGAGLAAFHGAQRLPPALAVSEEQGDDVWFDSDMPHILSNMSSRWADHRHVIAPYPLFILAAVPLVKASQLAFRLDALTAAQAAMALVASLWMGALFVLLRLLSGRRVDAVVFSLLACASASAVFWFTVPETWAFGSLTIVLALLIAALGQRRMLSERWYVLASALTLSMAAVNWATGLCLAFARFPWRRALRVSLGALALVAALWSIEQAFWPHVQVRHVRIQIVSPDISYAAVGPLAVAGAYFFDAMVMPAITTSPRVQHPGLRMTVRDSALIPAGPWSLPALWCWAVLCGLGIWGAVTTPRHRLLAVVIGGTLLWQLILRVYYGVFSDQETFLYSLYWAPVLIALAAFSVLTRLRVLALALAVSLTLCAGINNLAQFHRAAQFAHWQSARLAAPFLPVRSADGPGP